MAATETADILYSISLSLGKVEIDRVRDLQRGSERECVGECQHSKRKKKNQNMSEWIITIPRHRGMEREKGWEEGSMEEAGGRCKVERNEGSGEYQRIPKVYNFK